MIRDRGHAMSKSRCRKEHEPQLHFSSNAFESYVADSAAAHWPSAER
jgi:hypothetical protein